MLITTEGQLLQQVASTLYNAPESDGDEHEVEMSARSQNTAPLPPTQQCPQLMRPSALHHQVWIITIITIINHNCHHHHHHHYYYCQQEQEQEQQVDVYTPSYDKSKFMSPLTISPTQKHREMFPVSVASSCMDHYHNYHYHHYHHNHHFYRHCYYCYYYYYC